MGELLIEQATMYTQAARRVGFITSRSLQRPDYKMALPSRHRFMERHGFGCLSVEDTRCGALFPYQLLLDEVACYGPATCFDGYSFDQVL